MIPHLVGFIKSNCQDGLANSIIPSWRLVLKREKRDERAERDEPDIDYPVKQVAMVSVSEAVSEASSR